MINRRGFLKTVFGVAAGTVAGKIGNVVEALTTRKISNIVLSAVTVDQILDAKMFVIPYIPLLTVVSAKEALYGASRIDTALSETER